MKNKIFLALSILLLTAVSCKKSFLERTPSNGLPADQVIVNEGGMRDALNGLYASLRTANLYGRTVPLLGDLLADNVFIHSTNSNRYIAEYQYTFTTLNANAQGVWTDAYSAILAANNIINSNVTGSSTVDNYRGEALTLRALMYFELQKHFAKPYTVDANGVGVPLVLTYDISSKPGRNKTSEVYTQIIADLNQAYTLLTVNKNSSYISKYVSKALLARVYQHMGDWNNAKTAALDVVNNGGYSLIDTAAYKEYWKSPIPVSSKVETIFEVSSDAVNNLGTNSLAYFYDQSGYGDAIATDTLYNLYSATDVRKSLIDPTIRRARSSTGALVKAVVKYPNISNANDKDDTKVLRYSDVLLILAEAYYNTSDEVNAKARLNQVATKRDPLFAGYTSTGPQLLEDILTERRKELAFEGLRYWDLTRLNRVINRGPQYPSTAQTINITDPRRIYPIPQAEIDANKNVTQNQGY